MAPKGYTTERMMDLAEKAMRSYVKENEGLQNVACEYIGVPLQDGSYDIAAHLHSYAVAAFRWTGLFEGMPRKTIVEVRCNNATSRGVTFPPLWNLAIRACSLPAIADESAKAFAEDIGVSNVACTIFGMAKSHAIADESVPNVPGSVVKLSAHRIGVEYLLCAHVLGDYWLCSKGHFIDEDFQEGDPLNPDSLVVKNVRQDAWSGPDGERKRIRTHLRPGCLRQVAIEQTDSWNLLVAVAHLRAEELRAQHEGRVVNEKDAAFWLEPDPFAWMVHKGQSSKSKVVVRWSWDQDGRRHRCVRVLRVDHILERNTITYPSGNGEDEDLQRRLETAALVESDARKAQCRYLGVRTGPGKYEMDPARWPHPDSSKQFQRVYFQWQHVTCDGSPFIVSARVTDLIHRKIKVPQHPLCYTAPSGLKFSCEFIEAVANNVSGGAEFGVKFKGIAYEGEKPSILYRVPSNGVDIQDSPVYWTLPGGQCVCWSVRQLSEAPQDQLYPGDEEEAYGAVAAEMGYDVLGKAAEEELEPFVAAPGTLNERLWENIDWEQPLDETCSCWFIANAGETDKEKPVRLVARSLACLRLELYATRCATSTKLRQTWERRIEENDLAVDTLQNTIDLWRHVGGPSPETLRHPCEPDLAASRLAVHRLRCMMLTHGEKAQEGLAIFAEEIYKAVDMLKIVSWDAIRRERFFLTPKGLYDELVRNAQMNLSRRDDEAVRRRGRLAAAHEDLPPTAEPSGGGASLQPLHRKDKYGLDLNEFKQISDRRPKHFQRAIHLANEVHIDEMRVLLDIHYDEMHLERWQANHKDKKAPERKSNYKVFRSVVQGRLRHQNERLTLPTSVKNVMRRPEDENDWGKLEALRRIVCSELEGKLSVTFESREELDDLVAALEASTSARYPDELAEGCCKALPGWRVLVDVGECNEKVQVIEAIRALPDETVALQFLSRPRETELAPPMDEIAKALFATSTLEDLANNLDLSQQGLLDGMLLVLFDALFLNQCVRWTKNGVANFQSTECTELARWFLRGHQCSSKALFDGICSQCGTFLHGACNQHTALSNKCTGPPINRDGNAIRNPDGSAKTDAQPPFLLRWSPAFFAKELPYVFAHDPATNRLSLMGDVDEPWLRKAHYKNDDKRTWLYCQDCKNRWFGEGRAKEHITFRDRASQAFMKPVHRKGKPTGVTTPTEADMKCTFEPEEEPIDEEFIDELEVPDLPKEEFQRRPTLEEYQTRWDEKKNWHARPVPGEFSRDNLVPLPVEALWQDCPYVPFDELKSVASQSQLSVCRPYCSFEPANCDDGVPRYAHVTGDVNYRRRAMLQLAGTMGFLLNKSSGKSMGLTPHETDCVHECLTWGRMQGNNKVLAFFGTVYESFQGACGKLMEKFKSVIPEGCLRARIRATNRESREPIEGELGETLGDEAIGMVIVDSSGHPMKYDALNVFSDVVATQRARIEVDVPGPGGRGWRRTGSQVDTQDDLDDAWRQELSDGTRHLQEETWVPANDPHYDARVFPCVHPHGTGSLLAEVGSGGTQRFSRNRLMLLESWFRRSALWGFWALNRLIQTELFFKNRKRQEAGRQGASVVNDPDPIVRLFGTAQPSDIPESTEWWKRQQRDLFAITDEAEQGLMSAMVTVTMNDSCPEMLASIRRGPMAQPTEEEMIESLLQRKRRDQERPAFENHSLEHVIAFQRRIHALKENLMRRGARTPLGIIRDWWDRTEAQMRAALHAHILVWFQPREEKENYAPLEAIPREAVGIKPCQRPRNQKVAPLPVYQEDNCYHRVQMGRVMTEMVRPITHGDGHGGFNDYANLRLAGLARAIQTKLYIHSCSKKYCLQNRSTCRFFFPWPQQPQQQYCSNTERVAGQRRLESDDAWLNPHELYLAMFSPATVHVLPFDPRYGADSARQYAGKYASKAEKYYYMETQRDGTEQVNTVRDFLKCRTVGMCMAHNRLLNFRVVRSTRPVQYTPTCFVPLREHRTPRDPAHIKRVVEYPDPTFYLSSTGKYFYRHPDLRHLRLEQFNRYFAMTGDREGADAPTIENTVQEDNDQVAREPGHRHYDSFAEDVAPGTVFSVGCGIEGARRRQQTRLAVCRTPFIEPLADKRESYFEQKLLLGLSWFSDSPPQALEDGSVVWKFRWSSPESTSLEPIELVLGSVSFEEKCSEIEKEFCRPEHHLICQCCIGELQGKVCGACKYAVGFHRCFHDSEMVRWRKGTLHGGSLDAQRVLFNLHRRGLPLEALHAKADTYVGQDLMTMVDAAAMVRAIEQERGVYRIGNLVDGVDVDGGEKSHISHKKSPEELVALLADREAKLQNSIDGGITDQWRVYQHIIQCFDNGRLLRLMVQASAGTGKSFLMTTVMLWCIVNGKSAKAAAPTGIAASNVEIEGTDVKATTMHAMFDLDTDFVTKLDFAKMDNKKVKDLMELEVFLLDEVSMIDVDAWSAMVELLSIADHSRRPDQHSSDAFGSIHVLLFGDFKQLPPATSKPPFIVLPSVYEQFDFRVLRQNRRVIGDENRSEELEDFHGVLTDVSWGRMTDRVKAFVVAAYVRGAEIGCAERAELEGSTTVVTKRRYRDRWNRTIVRRIAKVHNHSLKIKGRCRARGARGKDWFNERRTQYARRTSRTQSLWNLHLSGDWHHASENCPGLLKPHMMRCMLVNNLAVDMCFVNGTQGRVLHWHPEKAYAKGKAISASHPEILVRFAKETSLKKSEMVPDIDHIDVTARQETLMNVMGWPVLLQVPLVPCYALTGVIFIPARPYSFAPLPVPPPTHPISPTVAQS